MLGSFTLCLSAFFTESFAYFCESETIDIESLGGSLNRGL